MTEKDKERVNYIAECIGVHSDKFPVPEHMKAHADFLRSLTK